jgi:hypothetical protein
MAGVEDVIGVGDVTVEDDDGDGSEVTVDMLTARVRKRDKSEGI